MLALNRLRAVWMLVLLSSTALGTLEARTRKGEKCLKQGQIAEANKDYDKALDWYDRALAQDPADPAYELAVRRVRFEASEAHLQAGKKLREQGQIEQALLEFQKAFSIDPSSAIAPH